MYSVTLRPISPLGIQAPNHFAFGASAIRAEQVLGGP